MSSELIGAYGFGVLFILLAGSIPIGVGMGIVGFVGLCLIVSVPAAITKMAIAPFDLVSSYTFATLPLFLLMGHIIFSTGQGEEIFKVAQKWFGRVPGGLAMATVAACAGFGAVCASSIATAVTMGLVAMPEMKKRQYDLALMTGTIAAGGTIGSLIPPSGYLLIYGIMTENSIAKLFIAGIIPGIIVSISYIIVIGIRCHRNPMLGPGDMKCTVAEKFAALKEIWEIILLVIFSIGGLIIGVFTATEAGAVGSFGALLSAMVRGKLNWHTFTEAVLEAMKTSGMIYAILIGAFIFNYFCAASGLPTALSIWVASLKISAIGVAVIVIIIYLILGALMDESSTQLLTIPIFYPLIIGLGFDPIWFGVIQARLLQIGMIAPPIGINDFVVAGLDRSITLGTVYKGVTWFLVCDMITLAMFTYWPWLITWLPNLVR
jgi:C4-dicarboxylate transporter DctM subunit